MARQPTSLTIAFEEEIGNPSLFVGRQKDLDFFLDWVEKVREKIGQSHVILARKRRGKTALVQRLYNILYSRADPKIIPFYFRVPEGKMSALGYCEFFMRCLLSQILGFKLRKPEYIRIPLAGEELENLLRDEPALSKEYRQLKHFISEGNVDNAWEMTLEAGHNLSLTLNVRIIQIIDEFQYLNTNIYRDEALTAKAELATFYQKTGSSKVSPQIITGGYIGWLTQIVNHMVGRYFHYYLKGLPEDEAVTCVYRYATVFGQQVSEDSAAYMAAVCDNDPYYIASLFQHPNQDKDLRDEGCIRATLNSVTNAGEGAVANMWLEYINFAFKRINDRIAKKVVLYLAYHEPKERTCDQILTDLNLDIELDALKERLQTLAYADLIRQVSDSRYEGLGDPISAMVFQKLYAESIDNIHPDQTHADIQSQLVKALGRVAHYKGMAAEGRVSKKLVFLSHENLAPADVIMGPLASLRLEPFVSAYDHVFELTDGERIAVDIYCQGKKEGPDLIVEVKDWKAKPGRPEIDTFFALKEKLAPHLTRPTYFLFHSEVPLSEKIQAHVLAKGLWYSDGDRLREF